MFGARNRKFTKLKDYLEEEKYQEALKVAGSISVKMIKTASEAMNMAKVYKETGDYSHAKSLYEIANGKRESKVALTNIIDCCLELGDIKTAEEYYDEFENVESDNVYLLRIYKYKIEKKKGAIAEQLIEILEPLKEIDYTEEYAYELARLYHVAGETRKCIDECKQIILWFAKGREVEKIKLLLDYYEGRISLEMLKNLNIKETTENKEETKTDAEENPEKSDSVDTIDTKDTFEKKGTTEAEQKRIAEKISVEVANENAKAMVCTSEEMLLRHDISETVNEFDSLEETEKIRRAEILERINNAEIEEESENINIQEKNPEEEAALAAAIKDVSKAVKSGKEKQKKNKKQEKEEQTFETPSAEEMEELYREVEQRMLRSKEQLYIPSYEGVVWPNPDGIVARIMDERKVDLEKCCKNFARMEKTRKQILRCLESMSTNGGSTLLTIKGDEKSGRTTLAIDMIDLMHKMGFIDSERTMILEAEKLNKMGVNGYRDNFSSCNLLVEHAGKISLEKLYAILELKSQINDKTCMIFEDTYKGINNLMHGRDDLIKVFDSTIELEPYDTNDLVGFAYDTISEQRYMIDKQAMELLRKKIDVFYNKGKHRILECTRELTMEAINQSEARTRGTVLSMAINGVFKDGDYAIVIEDDVR